MGKQEVLRDFSAAAAGYFNSIRIPATLVAGSSLGALFTFSQVQLKNKSFLEIVVLRSYHALVLSAFALALSTIIISTSATITMLHGRYDPRAETAYQLLRREFDYEFSVTRWSFLVALLCFILGVTNRVILEFDLLQKSRKYHLLAFMSTMTAVISNMLSYINRTLYSWPSLWQLTKHVISLIFPESLTEGLKGSPLQMLTLASASIALLSMAKVLLSPLEEYLDDDDDEDEAAVRKKNQ